MSNYDLTTLTSAKSYLGIATGSYGVAAVGSGYAVGDVGIINGGGGNATYIVSSVTGSGGVITFSVPYGGTGYSVASNVTTTHLTGSGTGFQVNIVSIANNQDDTFIQLLIDDASQFIYDETGRDILSGGGSLNSVQTYTEIQDGPWGNQFKLVTRNYPIQTVTSLICYGNTIPQSTGLINPGWYIEQTLRSVAIRQGGNR